MTLIMYILRLISGADPGFQVRGDGLKENCAKKVFKKYDKVLLLL
jgi:hypothetical protein